MTVGFAVTRPRVGLGEFRITPGIAAVLGVFVLLVSGLLRIDDLVVSAQNQWRPLLALSCIMVMTGVVKEIGAFDRIALRIEAQARATSTTRAFNLIFLASVLTSSLLNNDAAILLLTPVVVTLVRRLHPGHNNIHEAFVFAIFLAPGVAPFITSNPMNMIVAEFAGLKFNSYAAIMAPISFVGALVTFAVLRWRYRRVLATTMQQVATVVIPNPHPAERPAVGLLLAVFLAYPIMAALDGPIWMAAVFGAIGCITISRMYQVASLPKIASHISVDILVFLWGVFVVVAGLRHVGVLDQLANFYAAYRHTPSVHLSVVGVVSAVGSAIVDNHPMALLNMMALHAETGTRPLLAALIGGDIGPRLLPIGSLAGLLWMDLLRRRGLYIGVVKFVRLGTLALVPTLAVSLFVLWLF